MTTDPLDDLLERSAPATRSITDAHLDAMIADARRQVPRPRRRRIATLAGALALVLVGGAGVAAATDGFSWAPWAQDPVGAVAFQMANGFECELRFSSYTSGADPAYVAEVNRILEDWYRSADVLGDAEPLLPAAREHIAAMGADSAALDAGADMSELTPQARAEEVEHRSWTDEWMTWEWVIGDLETQALRDAGLTVPDERLVGSERSGQIQCLDLDGRPYVPGAGS
ncbi:hypothetical protein [Microbacterium pumilum]|uniref:Uncharacterized protein n=1 Tax=Microbacterium pumilum TaxID=344165 RepID=A0ABN2ST45_9MICO